MSDASSPPSREESAFLAREPGASVREVGDSLSAAFLEAGFDLPRIFASVTRQVVELLGEGCALRLVTDDGAHLMTPSCHHRDPVIERALRELLSAREPLEGSLCGRPVTEQRSLVLHADDPRELEFALPAAQRAFAARFPVRSLAAVPLVARGEVLGALVACRHGTQPPYTEVELGLLRRLAEHAALAISHARAHQELAASRRRLETLLRASELLSSSLDYEDTLENVMRLVVPQLGDFGFFDVVEEGGCVRRIARAHEDLERQAIIESTTWARSERTDVNLCALSSGETGYHPHVDRAWYEMAAGTPERLAGMEALAFTSMLTVPLRFQDSVVGSLTLFFVDGKSHSEDDVTLAEELGRRAAVAVWSARQVAALRSERGLLDAVLRQMPSAVYVVDASSGRLILSNPQTQQLLRLPPEGEASFEPGRVVALHPDGRPFEASDWPLRRALDRGEVIVGEEIPVVRGDGTRGILRVNASPVRDDAGRTVAALATCDDITAERRSRDAVRFLANASQLLSSSLDYESTLRALADLAVPELADCCAIEVLRADGTFEHTAAAHRDPTKLPLLEESSRFSSLPRQSWYLAEVLRTQRGMLFAAVDATKLAAFAQDPEQARVLAALDYRSVILAPLVARGTPLGVLSLMCTDSGRRYGEHDLALAEEIASRAALAIDNARLYREARQAVHARDEFLSIASHELKTPLTALQLQVDGMRLAGRGQQGDHIEVRADRIRKLELHTARLGLLVNQLLDVSKLSAGRLTLVPEEMDLWGLIEQVAARFSDEAAKAGCALQVAGAPLVGRWDSSRLDQVITNLVANALKYGASRPVEVRLEPIPGGARISVHDQGIGIAPEDHARIFERFERALPAKNYGGLGLGLWIAYHLVAAHGGRIQVESALDEGSTFLVELPLDTPVARDCF